MSYFMAAFKNFAKLATEKVNSNLRNIIIDQKTVLKNDSNIFDWKISSGLQIFVSVMQLVSR